MPKRPCEIESIVTAMRAAIGGGIVSTATGREQLDAARHRGQPGHQGERFEVVVPELRRAAEAVQFDHRQREIEAKALGLLHDLVVEIEARHVLRRGGRDQPAIVADRDEDADFHGLCLRRSGARRLTQERCQSRRSRSRAGSGARRSGCDEAGMAGERARRARNGHARGQSMVRAAAAAPGLGHKRQWLPALQLQRIFGDRRHWIRAQQSGLAGQRPGTGAPDRASATAPRARHIVAAGVVPGVR